MKSKNRKKIKDENDILRDTIPQNKILNSNLNNENENQFVNENSVSYKLPASKTE